jgi:hypothetical protein
MERYQNLKSNVSDITYLSELIPAASQSEAAGINSHNNLLDTIVFVSYVLIKTGGV